MSKAATVSKRSKAEQPIHIHVVDADRSFRRTLESLVTRASGSAFRLSYSRTLSRAAAKISKNGIDACLIDQRLASGAPPSQIDQLKDALGSRPVVILTDVEPSPDTKNSDVWRIASNWLNKRELTADLAARALRYVIDVNATRRALMQVIDELEQRVQTRTEQLRERNEELERFAFLVAHDLQAPLKTVLAQCQHWKCETEACSQQGSVDDICSHFARQAIYNVERMQCLLERLLEFARVGKDGLDCVWVSLEDVVRAVIEELDTVIEQAGASIRLHQLPIVYCDYWLMVDVFENLLNNALKFRGAASLAIHIEAITRADEWEIRIRDNGLGVDAKAASDLFTLFKRGENASQRPGHGIGLATCRKIVEHHGGRIWAEQNPGGGAAFCFTLCRPMGPRHDGDSP
ncbi:MAG: hypothetical protein HUU46_02185 [Candidatus Hydrogenedentes bacterium]|nr:hypothetical protein [Candidatus Hydrogenedentota bacterium]